MRTASLSFFRTASLRIALTLLLLLAAMIALEQHASAQNNRNAVETMNFDQVMEVDELGEATIAIKMTFTAAQFQNWQQKYGSNKSLLKRDMNKFISQYETYDWDVTEKQMSREITVTLKAKGTVIHKGRGVTEFRIPKEWRGGERRDNTFTFNYVEGIAPGVVGQFNVKLVAPKSATNFREQLSETGEKVIQYSVPTVGRKTWMLTAGVITCVLGAGLLGLAFVGKTAPKSAAAKSSSSSSSRKPGESQHVVKPVKNIDPPSMSTIPLEQTSIGAPIPERKPPVSSGRHN